jgi:hypothetical protein
MWKVRSSCGRQETHVAMAAFGRPRKPRPAPIDNGPVGGPKARLQPRSGYRMQPNSASCEWRMADNKQAPGGERTPRTRPLKCYANLDTKPQTKRRPRRDARNLLHIRTTTHPQIDATCQPRPNLESMAPTPTSSPCAPASLRP